MESNDDLLNLVQFAKQRKIHGTPLVTESWVRNGLAEYALHVRVQKLLAYRVASMLENGGPAPDREAAVRKVWDKVFGPAHIYFALELMGMAGQLGRYSPQRAPLGARWQRIYMSQIGGDHNGGSSEIIMNTVVTRILDLPR